MKFVFGLLAGALGTLAFATLAGLDWESPGRMDAALFTEAIAPANSANSARDGEGAEPGKSAAENPVHNVAAAEWELAASAQDSVDELQPIRSVTIDPLPAEPVPKPAPAPPATTPVTSARVTPSAGAVPDKLDHGAEPPEPARAQTARLLPMRLPQLFGSRFTARSLPPGLRGA